MLRSIRIGALCLKALSSSVPKLAKITTQRLSVPVVTQTVRRFASVNPHDKDFDAVLLLREEHMQILKALQLLDAVGMRLNQSKNISEEELKDLTAMIDVVRKYADAHHHAKEELFLFARCAERGMSTKEGPLAHMYEEHKFGREFVGEIFAALKVPLPWNEETQEMVVQNIGAYTTLLRRHISREERIVFPLCVKSLNAKDLEDVNEKSREYEKPRMKQVESWVNACEALLTKYKLQPQ